MLEQQPVLSDQEWNLILGLLENERQELPTELHHTHNRAMAKEIEERRRRVDDLIARLHKQGINV